MLKLSRSMRFYHQLQSSDCAAACLAMILSYHGKICTLEQIKKLFQFTRIGVSIQDLVDVSQKLGINMSPLKISVNEIEEIPLPAILYWKQDHFIVLEKISKKRNETVFNLADPAYGKISLDQETFITEWKGNNEKGIIIHSEPNEEFSEGNEVGKSKNALYNSVFFKEAFNFVKDNKSKYMLSFLLIAISLIANWFIPFIFQKVIDLGIAKKDLNIVYVLLAAQLILFISNFFSDFFSQITLTKINFKLSINLKNKLLKKLMLLPINYFDSNLNTETLQRLGDQNRVQNFLTWKGIEFVLNVCNIIIFGGILFYFSRTIFIIYFILSIVSVIWILFFLKRRATIEYAMFLRQSENNNHIYEFVMNMPEIKINDAQTYSINKILQIQEKLNTLELRSLFLNTYQIIGVSFISKLKEIISVGICALLIIDNKMTLGALLSISYVVGQLAGPVQNLVSFIKDTQDADISNKRIGEIYNTDNEDINKTMSLASKSIENIDLQNISFKYPGNYNPFVLKDVSFKIPKNSITAIVGSSGSGKTTLLKLLLSYYRTSEGQIMLDDHNIKDVYSNEWRTKCGIVLQDGHIFSGTIAENIIFSDEAVDYEKLDMAAKISCIDSFIDSLPMGYNTKIGNVGIQLSGGQKQRILIARAVYKNPQFIFFDEATSALDAENERMIHDNLQSFFVGKTVVVVAHRLSTVKNADQIIVLKNGEIAEIGNHLELVYNKSDYYNLIKNQLELGN
ncbi:ABC transporter ATP-binding protein [Chryseobacterium sp. T16E-39]|uniref:peptidase domain-containing ABC transporter n=1 Tax=Chryseobacterium sp. T16E-39 TaxID=2015076 RepID=UPI000B5B2047|nr:peptidase domain-containing ABC transporter [Chryseobacterium sp. T16E-39]ASK31001.1 ABC transporter ATP-binding protein [Chryseobacterium sp. T16E-39]